MIAKYAGKCCICHEVTDPGTEIFQAKTGNGWGHNYCIPREKRFTNPRGRQYFGDKATLCGARTARGLACKMPVVGGGRCTRHM